MASNTVNKGPQQSSTSGDQEEDADKNTTSPRLSRVPQPLTQTEVREKPWKYIGYKGYADFLGSDNDFFIFRRFASANARVTLYLQNAVEAAEEELEQLDQKYSCRDAEDISNGTLRHDQADRKRVLRELHEKLEKYNSFLLQQILLKKLPRTRRDDVANLENWHWNYNNLAIAEEEQSYLARTHDLFSVVPREKTPLRRLLERWKSFRIHWLWRDAEAPKLPFYETDVKYIADERVETFITVLILAIGLVMLIMPMWILQALQSNIAKLGTITAFVVMFLGMVSSVTVAKPFETLAATAAYAAVLMVFLQLGAGAASLSK